MTRPSVDEFVMAAQEYCSLAEREGNVTTTDLWKVRELLLRLIFHIPAIEGALKSSDFNGTRPDDFTYAKVERRFSEFPFNFYRVVFDPHDLSATDEPVTGMFSNDLADIYRDLSEGLDNAEKGHIEDACFEWSLGYRTHWARHALNALMAIELRRADNWEDVEPDGAEQPPPAPTQK